MRSITGLRCSPGRVLLRCGLGLCLLSGLAGCSLLKPTATPPPTFYSFDAAIAPGAPARPLPPPSPAVGAPTLIVNPPHAAAGFDSQRILYVRSAQQLEYFAHSEWVETPARMLVPLLVAAAEKTAAFSAVVPTPGAAAGDLRLDTDIIRLLHQFGSGPSAVRFTLRANLVDERSRRVLASREFDATQPADSDDPYGGVLAASRAVQGVVGELADFVADAAKAWRPPAARPGAAAALPVAR